MFGFITEYWNKLVAWNNKRAEKHEQKQIDAMRSDVKNSYCIDVKDNTMWIVCGTNALYRAEGTDTVESVINRMKTLENVNLDYKELNTEKSVKNESNEVAGDQKEGEQNV